MWTGVETSLDTAGTSATPRKIRRIMERESMYSRIILFVLFAVAAMGATVRLYLKDGTYQSASEYKVLADRVSYYSTERGEWEEIPLEMVDLDRTKKEAAERDAQIQAETKAQSEEDTAQRAERQEV